MTKKKNALLNERVIRRWGKLANMAPLTENWLEEQDGLDDEMDAADAAMRDPAMRDPHNRRDLSEKASGMKKGDQSKTRADYEGHKDKDAKADKKAREKYDKKHKGSGARKGDQSKSKADFEEALDLEVIDDEQLTEAVLRRVVERLLKRQ